MTAEWWIWFKRRHAKEATSANEVTNLYQANELNQYTNINAGAVESVYDADGNMTSYGSLQFTWDAENRLISVSSNGVPVVQNQYDYMSRRIMKATATQTNTFLYDGWNLIHEEMEAATPASRSYVWGLDLSQSLQGVGGVGGLLCQIQGRDGSLSRPFFSFSDANGNVTDLVDTNGVIVAHYEYDPYGNAVAKSGDQADANPFRFSSKYWDGETGLYYYGYRFYSPELGRWINRDPIGELGGLNLYVSAGNDTCGRFDRLGLLSESLPDVRTLRELIRAALDGLKDVELSGVALEAIKKDVRGEIEKQEMPDKCELGASGHSAFEFKGNMKDWAGADRTRLGADSAIKTLLDLLLNPKTATSWTFGTGQITCKGSMSFETDKTLFCCCRVKAKFSNVSCNLFDEWDLHFDPHRGKLYRLVSKLVEEIWHEKFGAAKLKVTADWEDSWDKNRCDDFRLIPFM